MSGLIAKTFKTVRHDTPGCCSLWELQAWSDERHLWIVHKTFISEAAYRSYLQDLGIEPVVFNISKAD